MSDNKKSKFNDFLESRASTYWGFGMSLVLIMTSIAMPFFALRQDVRVLEQKVSSYNTISSNHLSEVEADIKRIEDNTKSQDKKLDQLSEDIAELKALMKNTH